MSSIRCLATFAMGVLFVALLALATLAVAPWLPDEDEEEERW